MIPFDEPTAIVTERLRLFPLRAEDAGDLAVVLDDARLHELTGGRPATRSELRDHYARLAAGSSKPDEAWLTWVVRGCVDAQPIGTVQAALTARAGRWIARISLVVGVAWQRHGYASEAASAVVDWLWRHGANDVVAHVDTRDRAAEIVAARAGLEPTDDRIGNEQVWRPLAAPQPTMR